MRSLLFLLSFSTLVGCQVKTPRPVAPQSSARPFGASKFLRRITGRVSPSEACKLHLELLAVTVTGPEPLAKPICTAPVTSTGRYEASCDLKRGEYAVQLRNLRDGRTVTTSRIDLRNSREPSYLNEIDFDACGMRTIELATPEAVPGSSAQNESAVE